MAADPSTRSIPLDARTKRFTQGVVAANKVLEAHAELPFPTDDNGQARIALFWFYVGALAAGEYGISEEQDFGDFILGVTTRAPHPKQHEDDEDGE